MVKLIDSVNNFNQGVQCLNLSLLSKEREFLEYPHNPEIIELSKNYYMNKNIFVGNKWGWLKLNANALIDIECWCWCPLGFERNIVYK